MLPTNDKIINLERSSFRERSWRYGSIFSVISRPSGITISLFDWAKYRTAKGGLKIHTVWDTQLRLSDLVNITEAKNSDCYDQEFLGYPHKEQYYL